MKKKHDQNASFMVRFNQQIFEENGESNVQWRGKISHIQDGDEKRFSDFNDALTFMQTKLEKLTKEATNHESSDKQENILEKSISVWKTIKDVGPKVIKDTLKDPKKQFSQIQDQLQDQISNISEEISEKVHINNWRNASRSDFNQIQNQIKNLTSQIESLSKKIDHIKKYK